MKIGGSSDGALSPVVPAEVVVRMSKSAESMVRFRKNPFLSRTKLKT